MRFDPQVAEASAKAHLARYEALVRKYGGPFPKSMRRDMETIRAGARAHLREYEELAKKYAQRDVDRP